MKIVLKTAVEAILKICVFYFVLCYEWCLCLTDCTSTKKKSYILYTLYINNIEDTTLSLFVYTQNAVGAWDILLLLYYSYTIGHLLFTMVVAVFACVVNFVCHCGIFFKFNSNRGILSIFGKWVSIKHSYQPLIYCNNSVFTVKNI